MGLSLGQLGRHLALCSILSLAILVKLGSSKLQHDIPIGFLVDSSAEASKARTATDINNVQHSVQLRALTKLASENETTLETSSEVCSFISEKGIWALFSVGKRVPKWMGNLSSRIGLPHFGIDGHGHSDALGHVSIGNKIWERSNLLDVCPQWDRQVQAYKDLVRFYQWDSLVFLYEDSDALDKWKTFFEEKEWPAHQLPPGTDYTSVLKWISKTNIKNIILDCSTEKVIDVLNQAYEIGIADRNYHYIIADLDLSTLDWSELIFDQLPVITSFQLVDPSLKYVQDTVQGIQKELGSESKVLNTKKALLIDAVHLFAKAVHDSGLTLTDYSNEPILCWDSNEKWKMGIKLRNYIKKTEIQGLSGTVKLDEQGLRSEFDLYVVEWNQNGEAHKIGKWSSRLSEKSQVIGLTMDLGPNIMQRDTNVISENYTVVILPVHPFVMLKRNAESLTGNDKFEGYAIDLIEEISKKLGFDYILQLPADGMYGSYSPEKKEWTGMIGDIIKKRADMAVGDITITAQRAEVVDFTVPFMNTGIGILYKKPEKLSAGLLFFLSPFTELVWGLIALTFIGIGFFLFLIGRLTPYEWTKPENKAPHDPEILRNEFGVRNSYWFALTSVTLQGFNITPRAVSTRLLAGIWWIFALTVVCFYIVGLHQAVEVFPVNKRDFIDAEDLVKQSDIKFGCIRHGSTAAFFRNSDVDVYQTMWNMMDSEIPSVFVNTPREGVERVLAGDYAFIMESASLEYITQRNCHLTKVGNDLQRASYGIAVQKGSQLRKRLSGAILQLQSTGVLYRLRAKWWEQKYGGGRCRDYQRDSLEDEGNFGFFHLAGLFALAVIGVILALVVAIAEFFWKTNRIPSAERDSVPREFFRALAFVFKCKSSKTIVKKAPVAQL